LNENFEFVGHGNVVSESQFPENGPVLRFLDRVTMEWRDSVNELPKDRIKGSIISCERMALIQNDIGSNRINCSNE
jgi:hypothetical protein